MSQTRYEVWDSDESSGVVFKYDRDHNLLTQDQAIRLATDAYLKTGRPWYVDKIKRVVVGGRSEASEA